MAFANDAHNLHQFFEYQSDINPNRIAINCQGELVTYQELEQRANQWANFLIDKGVKPGHKIALFLECSVNLYVTMLGIIKSGAAYIPIDAHTPIDRVEYILENSQASFILSTQVLSKTLKSTQTTTILAVDILEDKIAKQSYSRPDSLQININESDLCYVIYTSGTTGRPKGVGVPHKSVCQYVQATQNIYKPNAQDKVYQGFSIAFDASLEEIWMAFASGATLVVGTTDAVHSGAALAEFLNFHQITILSTVPTMLVILGEQIPSLRLLVLGGEVCSADLVKQWSRPGLTIYNTYGPTEATIIATYVECDPNNPVTIGRPIPGTEIYILNENFEPTKPNEPGQLCIGGLGLAKEYINNPELTASKFVTNPAKPDSKIYLSGDLACFTEDGNIQFLGRMDEQIKLRGFRIELAEIEAVLQQCQGVRSAAVTVKELNPGIQTLVAYLVPEKASTLQIEELSKHLQSILPEYMVPGLFEIIPELPLLQSGKIDRKHLPEPTFHQEKVQKDYVAPVTDLQKQITSSWEELFNFSPISISANFFHDLGGHSLLAARLVSLLRKNNGMEHLSMLDVYENPTIQDLANKIMTSEGTGSAYSTRPTEANEDKEDESKLKKRHFLCGLTQAIGTYFLYAISAWEFLIVFLTFVFVIEKYSLFSWESLAAIAGLLIVLPVALFTVSVIAKWLLLGRVKPGRYRLWSWFYVRWWFVQRVDSLLPLEFLIGSPLINFYYRLMGAKIGKNCYMASSNLCTYDLVTIGDNSSIGFRSLLTGYKVENGWLEIGSINIGDNCFVGTRSVLNINTVMENDSVLEDLSMLPENIIIPAGQCFVGSPAKPSSIDKQKTPDLVKNEEGDSSGVKIKYGIIQYLLILAATLIYYGSFLPAILIIDYFYEQGDVLNALLIGAPLGTICFMLLYCLNAIIFSRILLKNMGPGTYKLNSPQFLRRWFVERLLNNTVLEGMSDSLYFPLFFKFLGADIGKHVEIGGLPNIQPDLLHMRDESFAASDALIGVYRVQNGHATFGQTILNKRSFIGNFAVIPEGAQVGEGSLIGCLSVPPANGAAEQPSTSWLGSPAVFLPKRQHFHGFSEEETFKPTKKLYLIRLMIEFIRILLPTLFNLFCLVGFFVAVDYLYDHYSLLGTILLYPLFDMLIHFAAAVICIILKWVLAGKSKESVHPLWSVSIWKGDVIEYLIYLFLLPTVFDPMLGTPFLSYVFRLLGMKIGKRVFIDTDAFAEFDLIEIGNDVALNKYCVIQCHLFEDRIFKMGPIKINDGCTIGSCSVVLYHTIMEKNSKLGDLSLLMKGETLPANSHWEGIPAQHFSRYAPRKKLDLQTQATHDVSTQNMLDEEGEPSSI